MKHYALIIATSLALAACGSGRDGADPGSASATPNAGNPRGTALDAFTSYVAGLVGSSPENAEPVATDAVGLSTSDTTEPAAL